MLHLDGYEFVFHFLFRRLFFSFVIKSVSVLCILFRIGMQNFMESIMHRIIEKLFIEYGTDTLRTYPFHLFPLDSCPFHLPWTCKKKVSVVFFCFWLYFFPRKYSILSISSAFIFWHAVSVNILRNTFSLLSLLLYNIQRMFACAFEYSVVFLLLSSSWNYAK